MTDRFALYHFTKDMEHNYRIWIGYGKNETRVNVRFADTVENAEKVAKMVIDEHKENGYNKEYTVYIYNNTKDYGRVKTYKVK